MTLWKNIKYRYTEITEKDVDEAYKTKNNGAPGSDGIKTELQ